MDFITSFLGSKQVKANFKTIFLCWEKPLKGFRGNGAVRLTQLQSASSLVSQQAALQSLSFLYFMTRGLGNNLYDIKEWLSG